MDREHHPVAEAVIRHRDLFAMHQKPRLRHQLGRDPLPGQMVAQSEAVGGAVAKAEACARLAIETARGEIAPRRPAALAHQFGLEKLRRELHDLVQPLPLLLLDLRLGRDLRQDDSGFGSKLLDGFREGEPLGLHHEFEDVAILAGGEIEEGGLLVVDEEGWRLLRVEGREPLPFAPRLLQAHALAHDRRDRQPRLDFLKDGGRELHVV